jgi:hypothetical protein
MATIAKILGSQPEPLSKRRPDLPQAVADTVDRCLSKTPADRFASAAELVAAVDGGRAPRRGDVRGWWSTHQLAIIALYFVACVLAWEIKEWLHGATTPVFLGLGAAATIAGVFRGHLVFTERMNGQSFPAEWRRANRVLYAADMAMTVLLAVDGLLAGATRPLLSVFAFAFGLGIALARVVLEPVTTKAAFPDMVGDEGD